VRFLTFVSMILILLLDTPMPVNICAALGILGSNAYVILRMVVTIASEICGSENIQKFKTDSKSKSRAKQIVKVAMSSVVSASGVLEKERLRQQQSAPVLVWHGEGRHVGIYSNHMAHVQSVWRPAHICLQKIVRSLYRTDDQRQYHNSVKNVCDMLQHMIVAGKVTNWPSNVLDIFIVLALAMKRLKERSSGNPALELVMRQMRDIFMDASNCNALARAAADDQPRDFTMSRTFSSADARQYFVTADDLTHALIYLQSTRRESLQNILTCEDAANQDRQIKKLVDNNESAMPDYELEKQMWELERQNLRVQTRSVKLESTALQLESTVKSLNSRIAELQSALATRGTSDHLELGHGNPTSVSELVSDANSSPWQDPRPFTGPLEARGTNAVPQGAENQVADASPSKETFPAHPQEACAERAAEVFTQHVATAAEAVDLDMQL